MPSTIVAPVVLQHAVSPQDDDFQVKAEAALQQSDNLRNVRAEGSAHRPRQRGDLIVSPPVLYGAVRHGHTELEVAVAGIDIGAELALNHAGGRGDTGTEKLIPYPCAAIAPPVLHLAVAQCCDELQIAVSALQKRGASRQNAGAKAHAFRPDTAAPVPVLHGAARHRDHDLEVTNAVTTFAEADGIHAVGWTEDGAVVPFPRCLVEVPVMKPVLSGSVDGLEVTVIGGTGVGEFARDVVRH